MEQEQIEEMANIPHKCIKSSCEGCIKNDRKCTDYKQAEAIYNAGYRVVPDGAVILTPEERDEEVKETNKILSERDELKAENAELKSKIEELKLKCAALQMRNEVGQGISEAANNLIKNMVKVEKKKAVQEFAEKLKKIVFEQGNPYNVPYEEFSQANVLFMVIDELLKEDEE